MMETDDFGSSTDGATNHRADRRVHARSIAPTGNDSDFLQRNTPSINASQRSLWRYIGNIFGYQPRFFDFQVNLVLTMRISADHGTLSTFME
jgi:hypothetical protein